MAVKWTTLPIIFESDCAAVVHEEQGKISTVALKKHVFRFYFLLYFIKKWKHILANRNQNEAAHECAA
jgi:hypothetical protein